jgi:hypothetical protein
MGREERADALVVAVHRDVLFDAQHVGVVRAHGVEMFAAEQGDAAGGSLRNKRAGAVRHAWPALAACLGAEFDARFDAFARATGPPECDEGLADGLAFVTSLRDDAAAVAEPVRVETLLACAIVRRRRRTGIPCRRRGIFAGVLHLREPHRLLIVVHVPWIGRRQLTVPL